LISVGVGVGWSFVGVGVEVQNGIQQIDLSGSAAQEKLL
jgi:hypothetical protein